MTNVSKHNSPSSNTVKGGFSVDKDKPNQWKKPTKHRKKRHSTSTVIDSNSSVPSSLFALSGDLKWLILPTPSTSEIGNDEIAPRQQEHDHAQSGWSDDLQQAETQQQQRTKDVPLNRRASQASNKVSPPTIHSNAARFQGPTSPDFAEMKFVAPEPDHFFRAISSTPPSEDDEETLPNGHRLWASLLASSPIVHGSQLPLSYGDLPSPQLDLQVLSSPSFGIYDTVLEESVDTEHAQDTDQASFKRGDWVCLSQLCNFHNSATNTLCAVCGSFKPSMSSMPGPHSLPTVHGAAHHQHAAGLNRQHVDSRSWQSGLDFSSLTEFPMAAAPQGAAQRTNENTIETPDQVLSGIRQKAAQARPAQFVTSPPLLPSVAKAGLDNRSPDPSDSGVNTTARLASLGVSLGAGVNPLLKQTAGRDAQDNPPIVNTGNSGPMCIQPGDWVCTDCGFINWRRRKVCMRCYPLVEGNEVSANVVEGAMLAAQIAAGVDPSPAAMEALANHREKKDTNRSRSSSSSVMDGGLRPLSNDVRVASMSSTSRRGAINPFQQNDLGGGAPAGLGLVYPTLPAVPPTVSQPSISVAHQELHQAFASMQMTRSRGGSVSSSIVMSQGSTSTSSPISCGGLSLSSTSLQTTPSECSSHSSPFSSAVPSHDIWSSPPPPAKFSKPDEDPELRNCPKSQYKPQPIGTKSRT